MLLRPRQELFVERSVAALNAKGNTLGVAPTGAGKTVMLSAVIDRLDTPTLVLQHRDELVAQNRKTLYAYNPKIASGVVDASEKNANRQVTFAMVQTLARNLDLIRRDLGLVVVDEAHHSAARTYLSILERARALNPAVAILGVTATPNRGDKKALRKAGFDNCADQITLGELIATGHLVRPRTFVIDLGSGTQEALKHVKRGVQDFDMDEVAQILDKRVLNESVVGHWRAKAGDRQTVVFCSTVEHARHVLEAFRGEGISAEMVDGDTASGERKATVASFDRGDFQVLVNVAVLTEGWDCPPVSCVILLRPSSFKSTMIQMIGRGLRKLDPEKYPGRRPKTDCIVMDFGTSVLMHGNLEQDVRLEDPKAPAPKRCPSCQAEVPAGVHECPICGHEFPKLERGAPAEKADGGELGAFELTEIDLFAQSPFRWEDIWGDGSVLVASSFEAWAMAIQYHGVWHALGGGDGLAMVHLTIGDKIEALASADDFLRLHGSASDAGKAKRWLYEPATAKQLALLPSIAALGPTKYSAACHLTWKFQQAGIRTKLTDLTRSWPTQKAA